MMLGYVMFLSGMVDLWSRGIECWLVVNVVFEQSVIWFSHCLLARNEHCSVGDTVIDFKVSYSITV